ncbi:MAG: YdeI/OmpD-associated family protein [Williamsia herbipolensis]|nr:YdeI/OmpD-associated family protein [Williamsia herbipolensis]
MDDLVEFEAVLRPMVWGRNEYVVIRLPRELEAAAREVNTRRLAGWLDDLAVNVGINKADQDVMDGAFVYIGSSMQRRLRAEAGDLVRCRLRPVDPDLVPIDDDVLEALEASGTVAAFDRRTPAQRRRALAHIDGAAAAATRERRIRALMAELGDR